MATRQGSAVRGRRGGARRQARLEGVRRGAAERGRQWLVEALEKRVAASEMFSAALVPALVPHGDMDGSLQEEGGVVPVVETAAERPESGQLGAGPWEMVFPERVPSAPAADPLVAPERPWAVRGAGSDPAPAATPEGLDVDERLDVLAAPPIELDGEESARREASLVLAQPSSPSGSVGGGHGVRGGAPARSAPDPADPPVAAPPPDRGQPDTPAPPVAPGQEAARPEDSERSWTDVAQLYARRHGMPYQTEDLDELAPAFDGLSDEIIERGRAVGEGRLADQLYVSLSEDDAPEEAVDRLDGELMEGAGTGMVLSANSGSSVTTAPTAVDDGPYITPMDREWQQGSVLANDSANANSVIYAQLYRSPRHGKVRMKADGTFTYSPYGMNDPPYLGIDVFWYRALGETQASEPAAVVVHVIGADIDADSDNHYSLERSDAEEQVEERAPGKVLIQGVHEVNGIDRTPVGLSLQGADGLSPWNLRGWTLRLEDDPERTGQVDLYDDWTGNDRMVREFAADEVMSGEDLGQLLTAYAEAEDEGDHEIRLNLYTPKGKLFHTDRVLFSVIKKPGLTALRPQTQGGAPTHYQWPHYDMFRKRAVPESAEETPGVGIRRNWDSAIEGKMEENDLIELQAKQLTDVEGVEYRLRRTDDRYLQVWTAPHVLPTGKDLFEMTGTGDDPRMSLMADVAPPAGGGMTKLWTEWADPAFRSLGAEPSGASLTLEVWAKNTNARIYKADVVTFHPFNSIVVVIAGEFQVPHDPPSEPGQGIVEFAIERYKEGYDVYMYDEPDLFNGPRNLDAALKEIKDAINYRGVTHVAIAGYSHGGAAALKLSEQLNDEKTKGSVPANGWSLAYTAYIDAIGSPFFQYAAVTKRPVGSAYHVNQYQTNDRRFYNPIYGWAINGAPTNGDVDIDRSSTGVNHTTIDDNLQILNSMEYYLKLKVPK